VIAGDLDPEDPNSRNRRRRRRNNGHANQARPSLEELVRLHIEKRRRESAGGVSLTKAIQLRPDADPDDFHKKLGYAIGFLRDGHPLQVNLRFRGRENRHKEIGAQTVEKFIQATAAWGRPDTPPQVNGRSMQVILKPLPTSQRPLESGG